MSGRLIFAVSLLMICPQFAIAQTEGAEGVSPVCEEGFGFDVETEFVSALSPGAFSQQTLASALIASDRSARKVCADLRKTLQDTKIRGTRLVNLHLDSAYTGGNKPPISGELPTDPVTRDKLIQRQWPSRYGSQVTAHYCCVRVR